jgi:hypothetical protein
LNREPTAGAPSRDQRADPLRPVDLVGADADQIDARMTERVDLAREALRRVDVEKRVVMLKTVGDLGDGSRC